MNINRRKFIKSLAVNSAIVAAAAMFPGQGSVSGHGRKQVFPQEGSCGKRPPAVFAAQAAVF